jgi:hypothetical protein
MVTIMKCKKCEIEHDGLYGSGLFCSDKCARSYSTTNDDKEALKDSTCIDCGIGIKINKRRSHSSAKCVKCFKIREAQKRKIYRLTHPEKLKYKPKNKYKRTKYLCIYCGKHAASKKNACCTKECYTLYNKLKLYNKIENENGTGKHSTLTYKTFLIYKRGHKCEICGNTH